MQIKVLKQLQLLYSKFDACSRCKKEQNPLKHILGGGMSQNPKYLFLFINPTYHNISSHAEYQGTHRYPFLGVRYFWKLMSEAGIIKPEIVQDIYASGWKVEHENAIEQNLRDQNIYITNLVKCTQPHAEVPTSQVIAEDLELLHQEIRLVNPECIITFGKLPTKIITGEDIKLLDRLEAVRNNASKPMKSLMIEGKIFDVLPCYFPVGRGNPPKAKEILGHIFV